MLQIKNNLSSCSCKEAARLENANNTSTLQSVQTTLTTQQSFFITTNCL